MKRLPAVSRSIDTSFKSSPRQYELPQKTGVALIIVTMFIVVFGIIMLYSTTSGNVGASLLIKQVTWISIGIAGATAVNIIGYKNILPYAKYFLIISCLMLIAARFCRPINGAYRWIPIPGLGNIQPSEFAKLSLILFLSHYLPKHQRLLASTVQAIIPPIIISCVVLLLILIGKDLGTTVLLTLVVWLMIITSGVKWRSVYTLVPLCFAPLVLFYLEHFDKMRWARITSFLNPEFYQKTTGYQLWFSILALGSGSWTGLGFAKSRMKAEYLPESHTDFILSIVGEELGYIAILSVIIAYILFLVFSVFICTRTKEKEGILLGFGITAMITMQAIINLGVVSGAFPTKGMPAPFISYGGSNMVVCLIGVGLIVSISHFKNKIDNMNIVGAKLKDI